MGRVSAGNTDGGMDEREEESAEQGGGGGQTPPPRPCVASKDALAFTASKMERHWRV